MSQIHVSPTPAPVPDIIFIREAADRYPLVDRFYRSQGYKVKTTPQDVVYSLYHHQGDKAEIIAAARLIPQRSGHYWLRNLLVAKAWRGRGLATQFLQESLTLTPELGCYCFALPHLQAFYAKLGFTLEPDHCPTDIRQKYEQYRAKGRDWLLMGYFQPGYLAANACPTEHHPNAWRGVADASSQSMP